MYAGRGQPDLTLEPEKVTAAVEPRRAAQELMTISPVRRLNRATGAGGAITMPVARYFLCVGGVLLALLFLSDAYAPSTPVVGATETGVFTSDL